MIQKNELIENLGLLHTTELGAQRIRRNLALSDTVDVVEWCRKCIAGQNTLIERVGEELVCIG